MIQKLKTAFVVLLMIFTASSFFVPQAEAARKPNPEPSSCASGKTQKNPDAAKDENAPAKICVPLGSNTDCNNKTGLCDKNPIVRNLNNIIDVLSGLVGVAVVGVIILGGIQYMLAGSSVANPATGKPSSVAAAKQRIINGLIALIAYLFIFAFLQWLVPGGIF